MRQIITNEIAHFLKQARIEQKISLTTLGKCIGKSSAFLSNIENSKIKTINNNDLDRILDQLVGNEESLHFFYASRTEAISYLYRNSLNENLSPIFEYDLNTRESNIPKKLLDYINLTLEMTETTRELLFAEIELLKKPPKNWNQEKAPIVNKVFCFEKSLHVIVDFDYDFLEGILDAKIKKTCYSVIYTILLSLKIITMQNANTISEEYEGALMDVLSESAHSTLSDYGYYSLVQIAIFKNKGTSESTQRIDSILADKKADELLNRVYYSFKLYLESDNEDKLKNVENILKNLQWDISFWMRIASMPYHSFGDSSYTHKKNFINEMKDVLNDYFTAPPEIRNRDFF